MPDPIKFYFDFSSPYAYFGALKIDEIAGAFEREVDWRPILLGVTMKATGNVSLAYQPVKSNYSKHDWERLSRFMDVPWTLPDSFPIATQAAARAFYWLRDNDEDLAKKFALACFHKYFGEGHNITERKAVADIGETLGIDREELLAAIVTDEIKQRLRDETEAATDAGVCGAPFFIVDGEPFWGSDRLWMIRRWLKSGGW
jgi:2-hydroxychromene-2-carboxylate isomerase